MTKESEAAWLDGVQEHLVRPVSSASLGALRALFGLVMLYSLTRFMLSGWVEELWLKPQFHFKYPFAPWAKLYHPLQVWLQLGLAWLGALGLTLGLFWRASLLLFALNFTYLQLIDLTNYLNHYYLVVCLSVLLLWTPAGSSLSLDALRRPERASPSAPSWALYALRFQVGLVYVFAALAKLQPDWLWHAQPLSIWLSARAEVPVFGALSGLFFEEGARSGALAYLMSWAGLLYDGTIVGWLLWPKSRPFAYLAVLVFHSLTWLLFDIGIFPLLMTCVTTIFFAPDWPLTLRARLLKARPVERPPLASAPPVYPSRLSAWGLGLWLSFQLLFPLRVYCYESDVLWAERGMRYSWRVMLREKMGSVSYRVVRPSDGRVWEVNPARYLEPRQLSEMSGQPDMIAQLARHISADFKRRGLGEVEVYAEALVSLNGRRPHPLMDPQVDLAHSSLESSWTLPLPQEPPLSASPSTSTSLPISPVSPP